LFSSIPEDVSHFFEHVFKQTLLKLRSLKIPGIKGRWSKTLGNWAGKIGRGLGAGVQVAGAGYEIYRGFQAQKAHEKQVTDNRRKLTRESRRIATDAEQQLVEKVEGVASETFGPLEEQLENQRQEELGELDELGEAEESLREILSRVNTIESEVLE
ncbi:MAG: hypothetical protein ABEN55_17010, partial [Bradymonadaceae bacterium]